jgi:hypothetical protein
LANNFLAAVVVAPLFDTGTIHANFGGDDVDVVMLSITVADYAVLIVDKAHALEVVKSDRVPAFVF